MSDWFDEDDPEKLATAINDQVGAIDASAYETGRRQSMLCDLELFTGQKLSNLYQIQALTLDPGMLNQSSIAFNLCYSIVSTIANRICSFKTRAQFMPDGNDHRATRVAEQKTQMSDAWADKYGYHDEASFAMRDLMTGDGGVMKLYTETPQESGGPGFVRLGRFPSWEFMVDEADGIHREPECLYHIQYLPVEQAARKFKVPETDLRRYTVQANTGIVYVTRKEMVRIVDAYQRGVEGGDPGKRVVVCGPKATVEDWPYPDFPIVKETFDWRPIGFWGRSAIMPIRDIQAELIEWQQSVSRAHRLSSMQVIHMQENEEAPEKVTNDYLRIARFKNVPGQTETPAPVNAEWYKFYETYKQAAYEILGVSQFIAAGVKQPGLNSAVAIRESTELQTDRLALLSQRWEQMRVKTAVWWDRFCRELVQDGREVTYRAKKRGAFYKITLTREDWEREQEVQILPASIFGQTYAGRVEKANELVQTGWLEREDAMKALDMPDLQPITDVLLAEQYARETIVDNILMDGNYVTPPSEMDPVAMYTYAKRRYFLVLAEPGQNFPPANVGKLKRLLAVMKPRAEAAQALQAQAAAPPAPPVATAPGQVADPMAAAAANGAGMGGAPVQ